MAGAVDVQVAREEVFESFGDVGSAATMSVPTHQPEGGAPTPAAEEASISAAEHPADVEAPRDASTDEVTVDAAESPEPPTEGGVASERTGPIQVTRHTRLAPYKPGKMTVVLDMDECLLHSKFHGPGAASEAYRQLEERPDAVSEVNSFWVALDDGDTAQVNKRPGLDPFLETLARDYNTIVFTAAMPDYAGPVLDYIDPKGTLFHRRLYRSSCRQVKGAFLKDLSVLGMESTDMSRTVLVDNNPLSFICQPTNGILVASFYDDPNDTALASVMQLIRHLDHAGDVRLILKDMFCLDTLLGEYRTALFDDENDDVDCILDDEEEEEEEELLESSLEEGTAANVTACDSSPSDVQATAAAVVDAPDADKDGGSSGSEKQQQGELQGKAADCLAGKRAPNAERLKEDDNDNESVKTEACSEGSGDSALGDDSLTATEEMELELEF